MMSLMPRENGIEPKIGLGQHSLIAALDQPNDKVNIYLFKINNGNTRKRWKQERHQNNVTGVVLVSLLLTTTIFHILNRLMFCWGEIISQNLGQKGIIFSWFTEKFYL